MVFGHVGKNMVESHDDELTRLDVDRDSDSVLVGDDTAIDVFVDGDGTVIEEAVAEDGYLTLTGATRMLKSRCNFVFSKIVKTPGRAWKLNRLTPSHGIWSRTVIR